MQLSTTQNISQRQSLIVSAQLQQAIQLLQLGNQDLLSFIEEQAEQNPFVEVKEPHLTFPLLRSRSCATDGWEKTAAIAAQSPSIYAHATAEINRLGLGAEERQAAEAFLDALEPSGWLGQPLELIATSAGIKLEEADKLLAKLHLIEPAGLFARNLAECLRLQAKDKGILTPLFNAVLENLNLLAKADLKGLARACDTDVEEIRNVLRLLRGLNPKPGGIFEQSQEGQRPPDLIVTESEQGWNIELNRSTLPDVHVRMDKNTRKLLCRSESKAYSEEKINVAHWLQRAVAHRNLTVLKVGTEIVKRQSAFLVKGPTYLRPLILREIADAIGVHESTVSRVTTGVLVQTPQGTLPLKAFFNASLGVKGADTNSAAAVRHKIKNLISSENPEDPLSDDAVVKAMAAEGIPLARRTVAKYREMLNIPSSVQRRRRSLVSGILL